MKKLYLFFFSLLMHFYFFTENPGKIRADDRPMIVTLNKIKFFFSISFTRQLSATMEAEIGKILNFFALFGLHLENYSKSSKLISKISRVVWTFCILFYFFLLILFIVRTKHLWNYGELIIVVFYVSIQISGIFNSIFIYKNFEKEKVLMDCLKEVSELTEDFLEIKIDWKNFVRWEFAKIFAQQIIMALVIIFRYSVQKDVVGWKSFINVPDFPPIIARMVMMKYIFYVNLLHCQMKVRSLFKDLVYQVLKTLLGGSLLVYFKVLEDPFYMVFEDFFY